MKTIKTTVYEFNELSDKAKENARDWYREGNQYFDNWKEDVIDQAKVFASYMGIEIEHIYFSGFSSQGDGACFEGTFSSKDVQAGKVKEYAPKDEELKSIASNFEGLAKNYPTLWFKTTHNDRYCHENSVSFDFELNDEEGNELPFSNELENEIKEAAKDYMRWIYKQLEKAYDFENSNEVIDENIINNEYTFTIDGKRFGY